MLARGCDLPECKPQNWVFYMHIFTHSAGLPIDTEPPGRWPPGAFTAARVRPKNFLEGSDKQSCRRLGLPRSLHVCWGTVRLRRAGVSGLVGGPRTRHPALAAVHRCGQD